MKFRFFKALCFSTLLLNAAPAMSHPVSFKDSWGLMFWSNSEMIEGLGYYSFSPRFSLGVQSFMEPNGEGAFSDVATYPRVGLLLKRWNLSDSQANVYVTAGYGARKLRSEWNGSALAEIEADWENRKLYTSAKFKNLDVGHSSWEDSYTLRLGFAPYVAQMDSIHSWIILQTDYERQNKARLIVTPLLRLFYQNVLFEMGYSSKGLAQINLMTHL